MKQRDNERSHARNSTGTPTGTSPRPHAVCKASRYFPSLGALNSTRSLPQGTVRGLKGLSVSTHLPDGHGSLLTGLVSGQIGEQISSPGQAIDQSMQDQLQMPAKSGVRKNMHTIPQNNPAHRSIDHAGDYTLEKENYVQNITARRSHVYHPQATNGDPMNTTKDVQNNPAHIDVGFILACHFTTIAYPHRNPTQRHTENPPGMLTWTKSSSSHARMTRSSQAP